jgi:hypothetical protein
MIPLIPTNAGTQMESLLGMTSSAPSLSNHPPRLGIWFPAFVGMSGF